VSFAAITFVLLLNECLFRYRLSPETSGYTLVRRNLEVSYYAFK
jgi:hypothetical protein